MDETMYGCMGPQRPNEQEINAMTALVVNLLRNKGYLRTPVSELYQPMKEGRDTAILNLRNAIEDIVWQDACECF